MNAYQGVFAAGPRLGAEGEAPVRPIPGLVLQPVLKGLRFAPDDAGHQRSADPNVVVGMQDGRDLRHGGDFTDGVAREGEHIRGPDDLVVLGLVGPGPDAGGLAQHPGGALGLGELCVAFALMGGVAHHADDLAVVGQLGSALIPSPGAVLCANARDVVAETVFPQTRHVGVDVGILVGVQEVARELADDLSLVPAGFPLEGGVHQLEALVRPDDKHHLAAVLEQPRDGRRRSLRRLRRRHRPVPLVHTKCNVGR